MDHLHDFSRSLLQSQVACVSEQEKLAGIAVGGWIAISALAGICLGVIVTLVAQCCWFNKQLAQAPVKAADNAMYEPAAHLAAPAAKQHKGGQGVTFSPLTSSVAFSPAVAKEAHDAHKSYSASKYKVTVDAHDTEEALVSDQDNPDSALQLDVPVHATHTVCAVACTTEYQSISQQQVAQAIQKHAIHQLAASPSSSTTSEAVQISPAPGATAVSAQSSPPTGPTSPAATSGLADTHNTELESEYEMEDLDDDWKALLNELDTRLTVRRAPAMSARERAIAIKKLLVATGTRGVDFAMNATLEEVLRFRKYHK
eukprot:jgi/Chrzof1/1741/Cz10g19090.t1